MIDQAWVKWPPGGSRSAGARPSMLSADAAATSGGERHARASPWRLALGRLLRNRSAMLSLVVFVLLCAACLCAPLYATHIAQTDPFESNVSGTTSRRQDVPVIAAQQLGLGSTPIGPTWSRTTFGRRRPGPRRARPPALRRAHLARGRHRLRAHHLRDRHHLGLIAGFFGGLVDGVISRLLDIVWAFPVYLLAIALSTVLLLQGLKIGPFQVNAGSIWLPTLIIGIIYVPYVARPIRGETFSLRAPRVHGGCDRRQGASNLRADPSRAACRT